MTEQFPGRLLDLLDAAGQRPVFEHGDQLVSGTGLLATVRRATKALRTYGVARGHGIGMLLGVSPEAFAAIIAAHTVGARVVGVRPGLTARQRQHVLADADFTLTDGSYDADTGPSGKALALSDLLTAEDDGIRPTPLAHPGDVARLIHTSGSTGLPKACAQTYEAMTAAWALRPQEWPPAIRELAERLDRFLVFGTLASQVMMEYGLLALAAGGTLVTAEQPGFPGSIERHRATASVITVARLTQLTAHQRQSPADLRSLRALMVSGSPLEPGRLREALDVLGPVVFHGYGQTETGMISMATPRDVPGSLGVPPVELEIRDASGAPVPPGAQGELFVRTPGQSTGYWREPALTAEIFADGWVRTRDLGRLDSEGRLWLTGRARDVIIVNANLYYAGPVERLLATHPSVAEAYVVGVPDDRTGEAVHAFVVPAPGRVPELRELRALVTADLEEASAPTRLTLIDEVPLTPAGKPDKRRLVADGTTPASPPPP
ncbi:class I adenylate-forming enzyme family protein [Streptomyces sp. NPDC092369]|uniref:class I adenylate-forming enzyme family protein n=1 Tax=Streptomyces sp. NPDC092369 TaxID=3366015 RepID=UPI00380A913B